MSKAPDFAHWTIDYHYGDTATRANALSAKAQAIKDMAKADPVYAKMLEASVGQSAGSATERVQQTAVIKTKNIEQQKMVYEGGATGERWSDGTVDMVATPGTSDIVLEGVGGQGATDFQGFSWLTRQNFQSRKKVGDREYLIFQDSVPKLTITDPRQYKVLKATNPDDTQLSDKVTVLAVVDAVAKLPVSLKIDNEIHTYTFLPAPTDMLTVPPEFAKAAAPVEAQYQAAHKGR